MFVASYCVFFYTCHAAKYASSVDGAHSLAYLFLDTCGSSTISSVHFEHPSIVYLLTP